MNKKIKILIWAVSAILLIAIIGFVSVKRSSAVCTKVTVHIIDTSKLQLISESEILSLIEPDKKLIKKPVDQINIAGIEKKINRYQFVKHAEAYMQINGELKIDVTPRIPAVRVCNRQNQHFRIDIEGYIMPVSRKNAVRVLAANGNISHKPKFDTIFNIYNKKYDKRIDIKTLRDIHTMAMFINSDPFWNAQVQQIFINDEDEIEISTLVGNHVVVMGSIENYQEKFRNLEAFYKKGLPVKGWNKYKEINLKYKNQVVCRKAE